MGLTNEKKCRASANVKSNMFVGRLFGRTCVLSPGLSEFKIGDMHQQKMCSIDRFLKPANLHFWGLHRSRRAPDYLDTDNECHGQDFQKAQAFSVTSIVDGCHDQY